MKKTVLRFVACFSLAGVLGACGGGDFVASIGGTTSGLTDGQSVVLRNNDADTLTVSKNGRFFFGKRLVLGEAYRVTVLTQPAAQFCQVNQGSGSVNSQSDDVTSVNLVCVNLPTLSGTVSGLTGGAGVTLSNGRDLLTVLGNGPFAFAGVLAVGSSYRVTVTTNPQGKVCTVTNGSGTTPGNGTALTPVTVTCA